MSWKVFLGVAALSLLFTAKGSEVCKNRKLDLMILMDGTISVGYYNFDEQKKFIASLISELPIGQSAVRVGIIQFGDHWSTKVELSFGKHTGVSSVLPVIEHMYYTQGYYTLTGMALEMANRQLLGIHGKGRHGVQKVLLLITDGKPRDMNKFNYQVKVLKEKDVRFVTVAVGITKSQLKSYKYLARSTATKLQYSYRVTFNKFDEKLTQSVVRAVCKKKSIIPPSPRIPEKRRCFQDKKDIVIAIDGSFQVSEETFKKAVKLISNITDRLDISASLIHIGLLQYSDILNTRIEFTLNQYDKHYQVKESLDKIVYSQGGEVDLEHALNIIDRDIFSGKDGDRISAEDFLVLFSSDKVKNKVAVVEGIKKLKRKGVHVIVIGLGKSNENTTMFYEQLALHQSDITYIDTANVHHIVGDLATTTCRKLTCEKQDKNAGQDCVQKGQDILFMLDSTTSMNEYFERAKKFFRKILKKMNIAASNTHVGLLQFDRLPTHKFKMGSYKFERDIGYRIGLAKQQSSERRPVAADIGEALRYVNKKIFNTSTGGHRENARDLVFIATRGNTVYRRDMQRQIKILKDKGVFVTVLDVGYKVPIRKFQNVLMDIASGPREVFPLDFKRLSGIAQGLTHVECRLLDKEVSPECFKRNRKVLFMLDSSSGLKSDHFRKILEFIGDITRRLHTVPSTIAVGLLQYSDLLFPVRLELPVERRQLEKTLAAIKNLQYRTGQMHHLGDALKYVNKAIFTENNVKGDEERFIILVTHSNLADPEKSFRQAEVLRERGVELLTVVVHTEKRVTNVNAQYKALSTFRASVHSIDHSKILQYSDDIVASMCDLHACPKDSTKDCSPRKQDIFMIVDSSRSIGDRIYLQMVRFIRRMVSRLDVSYNRTNVGIMQASDRRSTHYEMKLRQYTDLKEILSVINDMDHHHGYATYIGKALERALKDNLFQGKGSQGDRPDAEKVLIIFTDGVFHDEYLARKLLGELRKRGVRVVTIGLGNESRSPRAKALLTNVASSRSDVYLINLDRNPVAIEGELDEVVQHVQTLECTSLDDGPIQCSPESVDLFVLIDGSRSISSINFKKIQNFLKKLASEFDIGKNKARFGVLQYGTKSETRVEFDLDTYDSNEQVDDAIANITYLNSEKTETGNALKYINEKVFSGINGDRPDVPNILILFTDGLAHDIDLAYEQAKAMKDRGVRIIGIGAGSEVRNFFWQVEKIASSKDDAHKSDFDQLSGIVDDLLDVVCS